MDTKYKKYQSFITPLNNRGLYGIAGIGGLLYNRYYYQQIFKYPFTHLNTVLSFIIDDDDSSSDEKTYVNPEKKPVSVQTDKQCNIEEDWVIVTDKNS
jgi:hypothetical protein